MICLLILTAHEGLLEAEIRDDETGEFDRLKGTPRALLPSGVEEKKIIDIWWDSVSKRHIFEKGAPPTRSVSPARASPRCLHRAAPQTRTQAMPTVADSRACRRRWLRSVPDHKREQVQVLRTMGDCPRLPDVSALARSGAAAHSSRTAHGAHTGCCAERM
jgi:hypothetical protein